MSQITSGIRHILSDSRIYDLMQNGVGARKMRRTLCKDYIHAAPGMCVLDVGCGTAQILEQLPADIDYRGFDLSADYIDAAKRHFDHRGTFLCADITTLPADEMPPCNLAIAVGILHHLDDDGARALLSNLYQRLMPGGKLVTIDGVYCEGQSRVARWLISHDRGQNVRTASAYRSLVPEAFSSIEVFRRDDLLNIPYTHAIMVCRK
jgi:Methylase involved in ubiquinone/menaquinone biosynthesis